MRNYWIAFILIVSTGFWGLGTIVFKGRSQKPQPKLFYLNVDSMQMVTAPVVDTAGERPVVLSIFPCDEHNAGGGVIPWADLYVCRGYNKNDSLSGDTALLFIDIHIKSGLPDIKEIGRYGADIKIGQRFKKCRVMVPANQIDNIRRLRYRFAQVTLVDDWVYD